MSINELLNTMKKYKTVLDDHGYPIQVEIKKPKTGLSESEIQAQIAKVFIADGYECIRYNSGTHKIVDDYGERWFTANRNLNSTLTKGHFDLGISKNNRTIRVEVKTAKGRKSKDQIKYSDNALKYGNITLVMRSKQDAMELVSMIHVAGFDVGIVNFSNLKK